MNRIDETGGRWDWEVGVVGGEPGDGDGLEGRGKPP